MNKKDLKDTLSYPQTKVPATYMRILVVYKYISIFIKQSFFFFLFCIWWRVQTLKRSAPLHSNTKFVLVSRVERKVRERKCGARAKTQPRKTFFFYYFFFFSSSDQKAQPIDFLIGTMVLVQVSVSVCVCVIGLVMFSIQKKAQVISQKVK